MYLILISSRIVRAEDLYDLCSAYRTLVLLRHRLKYRLVCAMPAHHPVGAVEEDRVDLLAQADPAHVLVVLLFNFENLSELSYLLLQAADLLFHL